MPCNIFNAFDFDAFDFDAFNFSLVLASRENSLGLTHCRK
jgi:hypothetical protein